MIADKEYRLKTVKKRNNVSAFLCVTSPLIGHIFSNFCNSFMRSNIVCVVCGLCTTYESNEYSNNVKC